MPIEAVQAQKCPALTARQEKYLRDMLSHPSHSVAATANGFTRLNSRYFTRTLGRAFGLTGKQAIIAAAANDGLTFYDSLGNLKQVKIEYRERILVRGKPKRSRRSTFSESNRVDERDLDSNHAST